MNRLRSLSVGAALAALLLVSCSDGAEQAPTAPTGADTAAAGPIRIDAAEVMQVTEPHEATGGTLLEGPTFAEDGDLRLVDVMAPAGEPKVLSIDLETEEITDLYSDDTSAFTSAQFSPADGRLYLTDVVSGAILSITAEGEDPRTLFSGEVDGTTMLPDDITFDGEGNLFVSDTRGMDGPGWETPGRVVRISLDGEATVLASGLPSPNGIVMDETGTGLYVAQYNANRIDRLVLDEGGTAVQAAHPAIYVDGGKARVDSTAVDADGNIYQAFHGKPEIAVYSPAGEHLATVAVPDAAGLDSATNIAIRPGTTEAYMTVSGSAGGHLYAFDALAEGNRHSNGG